MHHVATLKKTDHAKPFNLACACGTGGDFTSKSEAMTYAAMHLTRLQGINSADFVDETEAVCSGEGTATTLISPVDAASKSIPSSNPLGTAESSSATNDAKTLPSTEVLNTELPEKPVETGKS